MASFAKGLIRLQTNIRITCTAEQTRELQAASPSSFKTLPAGSSIAHVYTEIGRMALKYQYLTDKGVKVAALSCNALGEHQAWLEDVVAHCENKVTVEFPIIAGERAYRKLNI